MANPSIPKCWLCGDPGSHQDKNGAYCTRHWERKEKRVAFIRRSAALRWIYRLLRIEV